MKILRESACSIVINPRRPGLIMQAVKGFAGVYLWTNVLNGSILKFVISSSLLYGFTGLTTFDSLYLLCSTTSTNHYIELGVLLMAIGLLFKVSAAPFHWPFPSIYSGVPTVVTAALSTLPKLSFC
ncbi:hypothetical protein BC938DRAFT_476447 [Jimgerdemannia flammicorona]|uniref:NADH-ubiquinone oxidoreductase chain 2 n=1 Tax=Jimgerdemannia flammicorona TaxID=994334 RepID=A0A433PH73_9FUNG|nr:hypothetical protein BC938DRAFT_476447 [Jimgerdemannia flammicorona]